MHSLEKAYSNAICFVMVLTEDELKPVLIRRPAAGEVAVIDWLNITMHKRHVLKFSYTKLTENPDTYCVYALEAVLKDIFGLVSKKVNSRASITMMKPINSKMSAVSSV